MQTPPHTANQTGKEDQAASCRFGANFGVDPNELVVPHVSFADETMGHSGFWVIWEWWAPAYWSCPTSYNTPSPARFVCNANSPEWPFVTTNTNVLVFCPPGGGGMVIVPVPSGLTV
jgi:hypothetical protein